MDYWKDYYNNEEIVGGNDFHKNVGRTKNGKTVSGDIWDKTIKYLVELLNLNKETSEVLELCCGNGEVIGNLASYCKGTVGVDYSGILLKQLKFKYGDIVNVKKSNILDVSFPNKSFDRIIVYFSLQYFNEMETIKIIERSLNWLNKGGVIFLGDIPDVGKKWEYISLPEYRKNYLKRVIENKPMIGNWFQKEFFLALSTYFEEVEIRVLDQPSFQINSSYRFDVIINKK